MKITIDDQVDVLYLKFNDNKVIETIELEEEINADIDANNKLVGLEVLHYSKIKLLAWHLLKENNLSLNEDSIVFFLHHGFVAAWFDMKDVTEHYTVCKWYVETETIQYDLVQNHIQGEIDFNIKCLDINEKQNILSW